MRKLSLHNASDINRLVWPTAQDEIDPDLPAIKAFTDFMIHMPSIVHCDENALDAALSMRREHVLLKLVVDSYEQFLGVVTPENLSEQEILKKVAGGFERADLQVRDFMTAKNLLRTLDYRELEHARLADVLVALKTEGQRHCLVVDGEHGRVRGVIAASEVSRRFNLPLSAQYRSTFADIFNAVHEATSGPDIAKGDITKGYSIFSSNLC